MVTTIAFYKPATSLTNVYFVDIFFNFHITYVNSKGEVVFDRKDIAVNYLKGKLAFNRSMKNILLSGWFLLDLLAALPFDLLYATCLFDSLVRIYFA